MPHALPNQGVKVAGVDAPFDSQIDRDDPSIVSFNADVHG